MLPIRPIDGYKSCELCFLGLRGHSIPGYFHLCSLRQAPSGRALFPRKSYSRVLKIQTLSEYSFWKQSASPQLETLRENIAMLDTVIRSCGAPARPVIVGPKKSVPISTSAATTTAVDFPICRNLGFGVTIRHGVAEHNQTLAADFADSRRLPVIENRVIGSSEEKFSPMTAQQNG